MMREVTPAGRMLALGGLIVVADRLPVVAHSIRLSAGLRLPPRVG